VRSRRPRERLDYALPFDQVKPVTHANTKIVTEELKRRAARPLGGTHRQVVRVRQVEEGNRHLQGAESQEVAAPKREGAQSSFIEGQPETAEEKLDGEPPTNRRAIRRLQVAKSPANGRPSTSCRTAEPREEPRTGLTATRSVVSLRLTTLFLRLQV